MPAHLTRRLVLAGAAAALTGVAVAGPAGACGGLVGENGTIELVRTTTLAAYHDGVERYVTSFEFAGAGEEVGSIIPLPDIPTNVVRGGDWTLQRLAEEVAPPAPDALAFASAEAPAAREVEVILEKEIDALDITILKGGGDEVGQWALDNGFFLSPDAPEVLDFYAQRSPVFMAARFDASRAAELGQTQGDGTPIMLTIPTDTPWVPLRILGLGAKGSDTIEADVFLLTDDEPKLLAGGNGLALNRNEPASSDLLNDLRSDKRMGWVPDDMWFTHLQLDTPARNLTYDLAISTGDDLPTLTDAGIDAPSARLILGDNPGRAIWPLLLGATAGLTALAILHPWGRHTTRNRS